jgi:Uma2 family endonuclease
MLAHTPVPYISEADYLAMEMNSQERHEYIDGHIFALTGASWAHNQIAINLVSLFHAQVKDTPCCVTMSDVKLKIAHRKTSYPWQNSVPFLCLDCDIPVLDI